MTTYRIIHQDDTIKALTEPIRAVATFVRNAEPEQSWLTDFSDQYSCGFPLACIDHDNKVVLRDTRSFA